MPAAPHIQHNELLGTVACPLLALPLTANFCNYLNKPFRQAALVSTDDVVLLNNGIGVFDLRSP